MKNHRFTTAEKLRALREINPRRSWNSLDEPCICILCEKTFIGRRARASRGRDGRVLFRCPTPGCAGTPDFWVRPGNPLLSEEVWGDWERVLSGKPSPGTRRTRRIRMPD